MQSTHQTDPRGFSFTEMLSWDNDRLETDPHAFEFMFPMSNEDSITLSALSVGQSPGPDERAKNAFGRWGSILGYQVEWNTGIVTLSSPTSFDWIGTDSPQTTDRYNRIKWIMRSVRMCGCSSWAASLFQALQPYKSVTPAEVWAAWAYEATAPPGSPC
jgi:hypothetical protein